MAERQVRTISMLDPAIDWIATSSDNARRFLREERENLSLISLRANERPTIYTLRVIPHDVAAGFIADQTSEAARYLAAFRASLIKVEDGYDADGKPLAATWTPQAVREAKRSLARLPSLLTDDELAQFDAPTIQEIGAVAWSMHAFFLRGTVVSWQLPPSVLSTWEMVRSRFLAAQDASTATHAGESSSTSAPPLADRSISSESPTDAGGG